MIPPIKGLHLEPTNICVLKCPGCARTRFIDKWPQHWKNHWLDPEVLSNFLDIELENLPISLCGNYGDPIYHPDLFGLMQKLKSRGAKLVIITNGSHRRLEWWQQFVSELDASDEIVFSIDGLPYNFTQYRINADWASLQTAIELCAKSSVRTAWKFIPFVFNEADIDAADRLAKNMGIDRFFIDPSARFDEQTQTYLPTGNLVSHLKIVQDNFKKGIIQDVDPLCHRGNQHFVSAAGFYSPCCFVADHRFLYKTPFGKKQNVFDITAHRLTDILDQPDTVEFYARLPSDPAPVCRFSCPKV